MIVAVTALLTMPVSALASTGTPASRPAGAMQAWGNNQSGDLGAGISGDSNVPVPVRLPAGTSVVMARAGRDHSLALTTTGHVLAWGGNQFGQLGNGTTTSQGTPVRVRLRPGTRIKAVRAGCKDSVALTTTGHVLAWGANQFGQLGNGTTKASDIPVAVKLPAGTTVRAISAGCFTNFALTTTGRVLAWGRDYSGTLGDGHLNTSSRVPVLVHLPRGITATAIGAGGYNGLALASTGQLYSWGYNGSYQLGDGTNINRATPVKVALAAHSRFGAITELACGNSHTLALTSHGTVLGWGLDDQGQLATGTFVLHETIPRPTPVTTLSNVTVTSLAAGFDQGFALTAAGKILAWGYNQRGQLGTGNFTTTGTPSPVTLPSGLTALALGSGPEAMHTFAIVH